VTGGSDIPWRTSVHPDRHRQDADPALIWTSGRRTDGLDLQLGWNAYGQIMTGMKISELAARTGMAASTLRYYEAEGLLPADRAPNGYRTYGEEAVDRLTFITQAKQLDLSLADIRELVTAWESEPCTQVRTLYRPILHERVATVDHRIRALITLRTTLSVALDHLDALPDRDTSCDSGCTFRDPTARTPPDPPVPPPVVCTLDGDTDVAERVAAWQRLFAGQTPVRVALGVRIELPIEQLAAAATLAAAEQSCCAFFDFHLDLHGATFHLTISAPTDAVGLLDDLLPPPTPARPTDQDLDP
jgi:DNA-binding transcriptional MerR regulator